MAGIRVAVGGNLGQPALDLLADEVELYVLELSSFQLESTHSLKPQAAVVLNVSADHMDRYRDLEEYAATKASLYANCEIMVINRDDARVAAMAVPNTTTIGFTLGRLKETISVCMNWMEIKWLSEGHTPLMPVTELRIPGRHNMANALAALALGQCRGPAAKRYAGSPEKLYRPAPSHPMDQR